MKDKLTIIEGVDSKTLFKLVVSGGFVNSIKIENK